MTLTFKDFIWPEGACEAVGCLRCEVDWNTDVERWLCADHNAEQDRIMAE